MDATTSSVAPQGDDYKDPSDDSIMSDMLAPKNDAPPWPWLLLWSLHYYILGAFFLALACYALYSALESCRRSQSVPKRVTSISSCILAIKILLVVLGVTRALYMYLYLQFWYDKGKPWKVVENILANMTYPCLTAGFGLMCQILYEASRLKAQSSSKVLASKLLLVVLIACHFVAVITAVTLIEFVKNFVLMLLICHGFFVVWGIFLIATFLLFSKKLSKAEKKSACVLAEIKDKESSAYGVSSGININYSNSSIPSTPQQKRGKVGLNEGSPQITVDDVFEESDLGVGTTSSQNGKGENFPMEYQIRSDDKAVLHQHTSMDPSEKSVKGLKRGSSSDKYFFFNKISSMFKWSKKDLKSKQKENVYSQNRSPKHNINRQPSPVLRMVRTRRNSNNCKQSAPRGTYRVKMTRKVMRIANLTAFFSAICIVLNTLVILKGLAMYYYQWKMTQTAVYIFNTIFRILELGLGFIMAYFTKQSIKTGSKSGKSFFKFGKKNHNVTNCTETCRDPSTIRVTGTEQRLALSTL